MKYQKITKVSKKITTNSEKVTNESDKEIPTERWNVFTWNV